MVSGVPTLPAQGSTNWYDWAAGIDAAARAAVDSASSVVSVAGRSGAVVLTKSDVGLGSVDNTADTNKPVSVLQQAALDLKATLASPTFTGTVSAPTPLTSDSSTKIATTAFVKAQGYLTSVSGTPDATTSSKGSIQLAGDLGGSASAPTVPGLALKANLASPTFTGTVSGITAAMVGLGSVNNTADTAKPVSTAQATAIALAQSSLVGVNAQTASYTPVLADAGKLITMSATGATTVTVPANSAVGYPVGSVLSVASINSGAVTVQGGSGVTVTAPDGSRLTVAGRQATLTKIATDTWLLAGATVV